MPLPPALAARLAKRGLIKKSDILTKKDHHEEEVIAEDYSYDDPEDKSLIPLPAPKSHARSDGESDEEEEESTMGTVPTCPNKWNPYHTCCEFCKEKWGHRKPRIDHEMNWRRTKMLRKYPLPTGWKECLDKATGRYYYWKLATDEVSWLPPSHPRAVVTVTADRVRELVQSGAAEFDQKSFVVENRHTDEKDEDEDAEEDEEEEMRSASEEDESEEESDLEPAPGTLDGRGAYEPEEFEPSSNDLKRTTQEQPKEERRGRKRPRDDLDPMDPASYSDVPRGGWSEGLDQKGSAKTGVDTTASGPLYQMRPYPSPGAVLRANQEAKKTT